MSQPIDEQAFARSVETISGPLLLFARHWNVNSAEDIVQEAVLKLLRVVQSEGTPENVPGWLFKTVRNEAIQRLRQKKTRDNHEKIYAGQINGWFEPVNSTRLDSKLVNERLQQLPLEQREVIIAKIWGELSFEEIGELVGTSRSSAHRRYVEGLTELKKMVKYE